MADNHVVERQETIAASPQEVWAQVGNLESWDNWSPWAEMDPNVEKNYDGQPGTVGSSYSWRGNRKVGEGRMTISEVAPDERIAIDLQFIKPFKAESVTEMMLAPITEA